MTSKEKAGRKLRKILGWAAPCAGMLAALVTVLLLIKPSVRWDRIKTGTVSEGDIDFSVFASGHIAPGHQETINSPIESRILEVFRKAGDIVEKGDPIVRLDLSEIQTEYLNMEDEARMKELELEKLRITNSNSLDELQMQIDVDRMELEKLAAALENEIYLDSIGAGTPDKVREARLAHTVAGIKLDNNLRKIENEKRLAKADENIKDLDLKIFRKKMEYERKLLEESRILAPWPATVVAVNNEIGARVSQTDMVVTLADLSRFKVEGRIGDRQSDRIGLGMEVAVIAGGDTIGGRVSGLSPVSSEGTIPFTVQLDNERNPALRSGLRCEIYIIYAYEKNVLRLPNGNYYKGPGKYWLFVKEGNVAKRREITLGEANFYYVEVISGIEGGDEVILENTDRYRKLDKIKIKKT